MSPCRSSSSCRPSGIEVGSVRWQPVFLAGIAIVVGVQALLAGAVLQAAHLRIGPRRATIPVRRWTELPEPLPRTRAGLDRVRPHAQPGALFAWLGDDDRSPTENLGYASLAQSLIIVGGTSRATASSAAWSEPAPSASEQVPGAVQTSRQISTKEHRELARPRCNDAASGGRWGGSQRGAGAGCGLLRRSAAARALGPRLASGVGLDPLLEKPVEHGRFRLLPGSSQRTSTGPVRRHHDAGGARACRCQRDRRLGRRMPRPAAPGGRVIASIPGPAVDHLLAVLMKDAAAARNGGRPAPRRRTGHGGKGLHGPRV